MWTAAAIEGVGAGIDYFVASGKTIFPLLIAGLTMASSGIAGKIAATPRRPLTDGSLVKEGSQYDPK
jgi:hypothetical protein